MTRLCSQKKKASEARKVVTRQGRKSKPSEAAPNLVIRRAEEAPYGHEADLDHRRA